MKHNDFEKWFITTYLNSTLSKDELIALYLRTARLAGFDIQRPIIY